MSGLCAGSFGPPGISWSRDRRHARPRVRSHAVPGPDREPSMSVGRPSRLDLSASHRPEARPPRPIQYSTTERTPREEAGDPELG